MKLEFLNPTQKLKASIQKQNLKREQIELFKSNIKSTFTNILESEKRKESEEHLKVILRDFLLDTYYKGKNAINTKERKDLVIHNGSELTSSAGVLIETKQPSNKSEMISAKNPNSKSFQQLISYYIHERFINENKEIKHLIITNIYEWYIFDASDFERYFFENKKLRDSYKSWNDGNIGFNKTDWFYKEVVHPHLEQNLESISCTYFNLKDYEQVIFNNNLEDDEALLDLYKILSPEHLLKKQTANDSNSLNDKFYKELLHIVGIEEVKEGSKKTIQRCKVPNDGSLLENALNKLKKDFRDISDTEEQYSIALELCITWLNRILFLKLLEGQLIKYNHSLDFAFLSYDKIKDYDELEELFFEVLAENYQDRSKSVNEQFGNIPYLNSSLFEKTELEKKYFGINVLKDRLDLPIYDKTVLRPDGYRDQVKGSSKRTLEYLFEFLNAYDFGDVSKGKIKEESKTIINASVLGLIFEKINGYKDGSFYTPSFITMYMCRESIRRAVIQKFNESYHWNCNDFKDLYNKLDKISIQEANSTINNLHICDPAVGSGHFLVSALNEIIAIKSDLEILADKDYKRIKGYKLEIENDELIIKDEEGKLYEYNPKNGESRRIQETLFHEKQTIIENCLFGVDINPKSVMICRLRLWIELLKNAYYTESSKYKELETLPNIDINIKCGNSLISRFEVKDSVFESIPNFQQKLKDYTYWVSEYKNIKDKRAKAKLAEQIQDFKNGFKLRDPRLVKVDKDIAKIVDEIDYKFPKNNIFGTQELTSEQTKIKEALLAKLEKITQERKDIESNKIYDHAFEWRFEFPEVLDEHGGFIGFDVVIGNPPWVSLMGKFGVELDNNVLYYYNAKYPENTYMPNLFEYFISLSLKIINPNKFICLIIPDRLGYNESLTYLRKKILDETNLLEIIYRWEFPEIVADTMTVLMQKSNPNNTLINVKYSPDNINIEIPIDFYKRNDSYTFSSFKLPAILSILDKVFAHNKLSEISKATSGFGGVSSKITATRINNEQIEILKGKSIGRYKTSEKLFFEFSDENINGRTRDKEKLSYKPKVLLRKTGIPLIATIDNEGVFPEQSLYFIYEIKKEYNPLFILGLFNSKLFTWIYINELVTNIDSTPQLKNSDLYRFPIAKPVNKEVEKLVTQILSLKKSNPEADTSDLEAEIDKLVYELYGLSEEEVAVIENK